MGKRIKKLLPSFIRNRLRQFRWSPGAVRWLPGDSTRFGPPRRWMRLRDYFSARPGSLRVALAEQALPPPRPALDSTMPQRFLASFRDSVPAAFVFTLHDARLLGAEGWVVAPGDIFLIDASFEGNVAAKAVRDHHIYRSRRGVALPLKQLKGRCLSLASDYAVGGFGHFVHDSITRLLLIEQAGFKLSDFDWIYVPHPRTAVPLGIISSLGVPRTHIELRPILRLPVRGTHGDQLSRGSRLHRPGVCRVPPEALHTRANAAQPARVPFAQRVKAQFLQPR